MHWEPTHTFSPHAVAQRPWRELSSYADVRSKWSVRFDGHRLPSFRHSLPSPVRHRLPPPPFLFTQPRALCAEPRRRSRKRVPLNSSLPWQCSFVRGGGGQIIVRCRHRNLVTSNAKADVFGGVSELRSFEWIGGFRQPANSESVSIRLLDCCPRTGLHRARSGPGESAGIRRMPRHISVSLPLLYLLTQFKNASPYAFDLISLSQPDGNHSLVQ